MSYRNSGHPVTYSCHSEPVTGGDMCHDCSTVFERSCRSAGVSVVEKYLSD